MMSDRIAVFNHGRGSKPSHIPLGCLPFRSTPITWSTGDLVASASERKQNVYDRAAGREFIYRMG
jgi:hypothetical protein